MASFWLVCCLPVSTLSLPPMANRSVREFRCGSVGSAAETAARTAFRRATTGRLGSAAPASSDPVFVPKGEFLRVPERFSGTFLMKPGLRSPGLRSAEGLPPHAPQAIAAVAETRSRCRLTLPCRPTTASPLEMPRRTSPLLLRRRAFIVRRSCAARSGATRCCAGPAFCQIRDGSGRN